MASNPKKTKIKCRSYLVEYIKFGFVPCPSNIQCTTSHVSFV